MSDDSIIVEDMCKDDQSFGLSQQPDEIVDEKSQKMVKTQ